MLKIKNRAMYFQNITRTVKSIFVIICFIMCCSSFHSLKHPFYLSVIDIKDNSKEKSLEISIKLFTNDLENALKNTSKKSIDLLNPKIKSEMDSVLSKYIKKRFHVNLNSKKQYLSYIGYEKEEEAIWVYLEIENCIQPKMLFIDTKLLYDFLPQQINIVHIEINGIKKSSKVTNPDSKIEFIL